MSKKFKVFASRVATMTPEQVHQETFEIQKRIMEQVTSENAQYANTLTRLSMEYSKPGADFNQFMRKMDAENARHRGVINDLRAQAEDELAPYGISLYFSKKAEGKAITASNALDDNSPQLEALGNYLPPRGEGGTLASQVSTAVNKLVYKWFNDGDVYDNNYGQEGWANDLSSYANWLYKYAISSPWGRTKVPEILERIYDAGSSESAYEAILAALVEETGDAEFLEDWDSQPKQGSVYDCDGPFSFGELEDDEDYDYEDEEDDDYEDEEDYDEDEDV